MRTLVIVYCHARQKGIKKSALVERLERLRTVWRGKTADRILCLSQTPMKRIVI